MSASSREPICAPRLKTTTSMGPISASTSAIRSSRVSGSLASRRNPDAEPPASSMSPTSFLRPSSSLLRHSTALYPSVAKCFPTCPPIPAPAPITKHTGFILSHSMMQWERLWQAVILAAAAHTFPGSFLLVLVSLKPRRRLCLPRGVACRRHRRRQNLAPELSASSRSRTQRFPRWPERPLSNDRASRHYADSRTQA